MHPVVQDGWTGWGNMGVGKPAWTDAAGSGLHRSRQHH